MAQVEAQPEEQKFLGSLEDSMPPVTKNPWEVNLILNGMPVLLKIDTGADVSAIPETVLKQLQQVSLIHSDRRLTSPSQHQLQVFGQFTANLKYGPNETQETIFVAKKASEIASGPSRN